MLRRTFLYVLSAIALGAKEEMELTKPTSPLMLLASAICTEEGWYNPDPTVWPRKLNNPGDLVYAGQTNAVRAPGTALAQFPTPEAGKIALLRQILLFAAMGHTLREIIDIWAPPSENNTALYLANVVKWTGLEADVPLMNQLDPLVNLDAVIS